MQQDTVKDGEIDPKCIFVFYTPVSNNSIIDFNEPFPTGWWWVGSGTTYPICNTQNWKGWLCQLYRNIFGPPTKYENDSQFIGPAETREIMKERLDKNFSILKEKGVIKFYKIQDTFCPVPV